jgi:2-phosphoglycerate kinase
MKGKRDMSNKKKHTLYIIGGLSRVGKTIVFEKLMARRHAITIQTDAVRAAMRKVLIGESYVAVEKMRISVYATLHRHGSLTAYTKNHTQRPKGEDDLAWAGVLGLIETYDRKDSADVIIEGVAITPERIHALTLKNLSVRAAFIGYGDSAHLQAILAYSEKKKDWVHTSIKEHGGDASHVTKWARDGVVKSRKLKKHAEEFGYGYFDVSARPFREHAAAVLAYLLK